MISQVNQRHTETLTWQPASRTAASPILGAYVAPRSPGLPIPFLRVCPKKEPMVGHVYLRVDWRSGSIPAGLYGLGLLQGLKRGADQIGVRTFDSTLAVAYISLQ